MPKQNSSYTSARPENDLRMQKQALTASWWGLGMQALLALVAAVLGIMSGWVSPLPTVSAFALYGVLPWLAILIATAFRRAKAMEDYELETARRTGESDRTIFETEIDARPAGRRLARVYRWGLPVAAGLLGLLLATRGLWALRNAATFGGGDLVRANYLAGLFAVAAFVGFVLGRYLLGMSTQGAWGLLRGGATYLIGTVYVFALMALSAGSSHLGWEAVNGIMRYVIPAVALLVGAEVLLNIVLDLYRPKGAEQTPRPAFDSRLLALGASPGDIVQSLNEAVNYQFGFEITRSWFWRLLSRSFGWLVLFGVMILVLLSSIVVVEPHQRALLTSFGRLRPQPMDPGIWIKWPWPLAVEDKFDVTRVREMVVGSHTRLHRDMPLLWGNKHTSHAEDLHIVAGSPELIDDSSGITAAPVIEMPSRGLNVLAPARSAPAQPLEPGAAIPPVSLVAVDMVVHWKIDSNALIDFAVSSEDPEQRLRHLASGALTRELLRHPVDDAIGLGRPAIAAAVEEALREKVKQDRLGIEIVWVGIANVHPPQNVAEEFNSTAAAVQMARQARERGLHDQTAILTAVAGSDVAARRILQEHQKLEQLRQQHQQLRQAQQSGGATQEQLQEVEAQLVSQQAELERMIQRAGGTAGTELLQARRTRWAEENQAMATAALQPGEYAAFLRAPRYYSFRRYLEVIAQAMPERRKYVLLTDDESPQIELDLKEAIDAFSSAMRVPERINQDAE